MRSCILSPVGKGVLFLANSEFREFVCNSLNMYTFPESSRSEVLVRSLFEEEFLFSNNKAVFFKTQLSGKSFLTSVKGGYYLRFILFPAHIHASHALRFGVE